MAKRKRKPLDLTLANGELGSAEKYCKFSWIRNAIDHIGRHDDMNIGDVLVHINADGSVYKSDGIPERHVVVHRDSYGLVYTKRLMSNGKLTKTVTCVTAESNKHGRYDYDPEHVESILLGEEDGYDPLEKNREMISKRNKIRRLNKKKRYDKFNEKSFFIKFLRNLKPGTKMWCASSLGERVSELTFKKCYDEKKTRSSHSYRVGGVTEEYTIVVAEFMTPDNKEYKINESNYYRFHETYYKEKPTNIEEV